MTGQVCLAIWAWSGLALHLGVGLLFLRGMRQLVRLTSIDPSARHTWPKVSIVLAARNEERHLEAALETLLSLDYPDLEIVAVNDRSTDRTGSILERIAARDRRLLVLNVDHLPSGWLGKNHALYRGAMSAQGDWILFTDADVFLEPDVLRRAVHYAEQSQLDLLAALPGILMPGWLLQTFCLVFVVYFCLYFQPWRARLRNSRNYVGVGAFTLVRASAYRELGGHSRIAVRPDDDVRLGQLFKLQGHRIDVVRAPELVRVPWYSSWKELVRGLEKNLFAGVDYRIDLTILSSVAALLFNVAPFVWVFFTGGLTRWAFGASCLILWGMAAVAAAASRLSLFAAIGFPLAVLLFVFVQWRTMVVNLWNGGIRWRDTFYSFDELKAG